MRVGLAMTMNIRYAKWKNLMTQGHKDELKDTIIGYLLSVVFAMRLEDSKEKQESCAGEFLN